MYILGFIHRAICFGQQFFGRQTILRIKCSADTRGNRHFAADRLASFLDRQFPPRHKFLERCCVRFPKNQNEFVSSKAPDQIVVTAYGAEVFGDLLQEFGSNEMAIMIIYRLKAIKVAEKDGKRLPTALGMAQLPSQMSKNRPCIR